MHFTPSELNTSVSFFLNLPCGGTCSIPSSDLRYWLRSQCHKISNTQRYHIVLQEKEKRRNI